MSLLLTVAEKATQQVTTWPDVAMFGMFGMFGISALIMIACIWCLHRESA